MTRARFAVVTAGVLAAAALLGSATAKADTVNGVWAGYLANSDGPRFTAIGATFTVPTANCSLSHSSDPQTYAWTGFDGDGDSLSVEQDGIAVACQDGLPFYWAWWEMFPAPAHAAAVNVSPGDVIRSATRYGPAGFELSLTDNGAPVFDVTRRCPTGSCPRLQAEAVVEDPGGGVATGNDLATLTGPVAFSNVSVGAGRQFGGLSSTSGYRVSRLQMDDPGQQRLASTGRYSNNAFGVTVERSS